MSRALLTVVLLTALSCASVPKKEATRVVAPMTEGERQRYAADYQQLEASHATDDFAAATFTSSRGSSIPYRILAPSGSSTKLPLVIVLHGSGAIGNDNLAQLSAFVKRWATPAMRASHPAIVVAPQFASRPVDGFETLDGQRRSRPTPLLRDTVELIRTLQQRADVDASRTYAIGFSMGAGAVWNLFDLDPNLLRAAVVVSGVPPARRAANGDTPLLIIHGDADQVTPFFSAWSAFQQGSASTEFWRFSGVAHEVPYPLILRNDVADWLFAH